MSGENEDGGAFFSCDLQRVVRGVVDDIQCAIHNNIHNKN